MEIDFKNIRPLDGDRRLGFEELCCQLAEIDVEQETAQDFARGNFHRKEGKAGDAGVECYFVLSGNEEWGWQTKYFIDGLGPAQWKQIDESVKTALERHPRLVRYTICLPVDLSDSRVPGKTSQWDHWERHEKKWTKWARDKGSHVKFVLWGAYKLRKQLIELGDRGAGYLLYWFDETILTADWFRIRLEEAIGDAGPRYTPELHVDLPICSLFDSFGRTDSFLDTIASLYDRLLRKWKDTNRRPEIQETAELSEAVIGLAQQVLGLTLSLDRIRKEAFQEIGLDELLASASSAMEKNSYCMLLAKRVRREKEGGDPSSRNEPSVLEHYLSELHSILADIAAFTDSREARLGEQRAVLLSGEAGTGKTHLFCDLAEKRIKDGLPTVVLLGQKFSPGRIPWSQIVDHLYLGGIEPEKFLGALDAAAWVSGKRALILIDALNEGAGAELWRAHLAGLLTALSHYPRVVLAASCRESYVEDVIPEALLTRGDIYRLRHHGFEGHEFDATRSFFEHYGIQSPAEPLLVPEFSNPLFLKLLCKGLANEGRKQVPRGLKGITRLFDFFIDSVNRKLSKNLCMDEKDGVVPQVLDALAQRMAEEERNWLERKEAKALIHGVRPEPPEYEQTLFRNLLHEGLLREDRYRLEADQCRIDVVSFAYERLSDHLVVSRWLRPAVDLKKTKAIRDALPIIKRMADDNWFARRHAGWVEALSIQIPELLSTELVHLAPGFKKSTVFRDAFLVSLLWRGPTTVGPRAIRFLNEILGYCSQEEFESAMDVFLMVACDPGHRLNARWLHKRLSRYSMGDRDHIWSIFLHDQYQWQGESPVRRLIDWAWNADKARATDEVIELCGIVLTWFLTSSHRFLRDRATKALVSMLRERPRVLLRLLKHFQSVDDSYVLERLYAVSYGVAMLTDDEAVLEELVKLVFKRIFADASIPPHVLLRDYARGVIEVAHHRQVLPASVNRDLTIPPYRTKWPLTIPTESELAIYGEWPSDLTNRNDLKWPAARLYGWLMEPMGGLNDWVIYELRPTCENFVTVRPEALGVYDLSCENPEPTRAGSSRFDVRLAQRWIMNRVLDLGWTPERFGEFDERVEGDVFYRRIDVSKPERMGKKYAWIGMHEFLGYLSDHVAYCGDSWRGEPSTYCGPWQLRLRDIDPSLLMKRTSRTDDSEMVRCWWQPVDYQFVEQSVKDYQSWVKDCSDLGDPLDLIQVRDVEGQEWLILDSFYRWTEDTPLGEERYENPRRNLRITINSFIVSTADSDSLAEWINGQPLRVKSMPELEGLRGVFLGEYPWGLSCKPYADGQGWTSGYDSQLPYPVVVTATDYLREPRGYDCSIDEPILALLPSPWVVENTRLDWSRKGFSFVDGSGCKVAFDPSEHEEGPGALLFRKDAVIAFLKEINCDLLWTVVTERAVQHSALRPLPEPYEGRMTRQTVCTLHYGELRASHFRDDFEP